MDHVDDLAIVDVPEFLEEDTEYDTQYKRTLKWDVEKGDFARDGANRVQECTGEEGYAIWCYKTALTERYSCLAYPDEIGVEMEDATDDDDADIIESQVERAVTEAIEVNPRTEWIGDFEFSWDSDAMHFTFCVRGVGWDQVFKISV